MALGLRFLHHKAEIYTRFSFVLLKPLSLQGSEKAKLLAELCGKFC